MIDINELIKHPCLKQIIDQYQLGQEAIYAGYSTILRSINSLEKCRDCNGLHCCGQDKKGEYYTLLYDGGFYNEIAYCKFLIEQNKKEQFINHFVYSDIPDKYYSLTLENIPLCDENIKHLCALCNLILLNKRNKGLYILGDLGVGKTYMCIALANSLNKANKKVAFVKTNYFINEMRKLVINNSGEYEQRINKLKMVQYLILDDIGSETVSSFSRDDILFNILDYRMENNLCTIFTSNLSKENLLKHYTYDKTDNAYTIGAKRLLERIDILSDTFVLSGNNKRRENG